MEKNTAVITLPITLPTPHLSSPFQSQTYFHIRFSLLWCHFPLVCWICSPQGPQWLLCHQWAFIILALSPLCNSGCCWPCFPSGNVRLPFFSVCNHALSVSCARCFSILSLHVDSLQVAVLELCILQTLSRKTPTTHMASLTIRAGSLQISLSSLVRLHVTFSPSYHRDASIWKCS